MYVLGCIFVADESTLQFLGYGLKCVAGLGSSPEREEKEKQSLAKWT
jgi:hypothetical protein